MVRRAFGPTFGDHEIEDIYANAWVGTLRALERRHSELDDEEIRKYVFTAVAHQAGKELRRRRRKPVAPMEKAELVADTATSPDERAEGAEQSRITRDLLASLPRRRRAVLLLRYGWGLEPSQVCGLIAGLSPRAYRKEITRGIDELTERIRTLEAGGWCDDREPVLKAFAAGIADGEQVRQAQHHLSHCRRCSEFVGKLSGHLHDLGGATVLPGALDLADGRLDVVERLAELEGRIRDAGAAILSRGGQAPPEASSPALAAAAPRGAGATGAGILAKLAGLGAAGKATVACLGGGAAAAVCVAAGVGPLSDGIARAPGETLPGDPVRVESDPRPVLAFPAAVAAPRPTPAAPAITPAAERQPPPPASPLPPPPAPTPTQPPAPAPPTARPMALEPEPEPEPLPRSSSRPVGGHQESELEGAQEFSSSGEFGWQGGGGTTPSEP